MQLAMGKDEVYEKYEWSKTSHHFTFFYFTELEFKIYRIVAGIPAGQVMTYGQVAEAAGNKNLCRVVGNTMHKNPVPFVELARKCGYTGDFEIDSETETKFRDMGIGRVPCHRVVNASGSMGKNFGLGGPEVQKKMLLEEGRDTDDQSEPYR